MKKLAVLAVLALVAVIGTGVVVAGGGEKAKRGVLGDEVFIAYATCWTGATESCQPVKKYSGREWSAEGKIEGVGKATVLVSASWDWGRGHTLPNELYSADHPCALINKTPQGFGDTNADTPTDGNWTAAATVTITTKKGDTIDGAIVGGSVCELVVHPVGGGSINEWLISFEIVGGTGKFDAAEGTGLIRMLWDSGVGDPAYGPKTNPDRWKDHEIFLHLSH